MGAQLRIYRRRIRSVKSTKKITRAMELIAATRVVKAQQRANEARPYAEHITQVIEDLSAAIGYVASANGVVLPIGPGPIWSTEVRLQIVM